MKVKELYEQYKSSYVKILDKFDVHGWEELEMHENAKWYSSGDNYMTFIEEECEYGFESAQQCGEEVDGFNLFYVFENGQNFYVLFKSENKMSESEIEKLDSWF